MRAISTTKKRLDHTMKNANMDTLRGDWREAGIIQRERERERVRKKKRKRKSAKASKKG